MTLTDLKNRKLEKGFTIVELLIVIVVIAILAALVLTAYNGVQARARDSARQSDVRSVATAAEAYASENGGTYPSLAQVEAYTVVKIDDSIKTDLAATPEPSASAKDAYQYLLCGSGAGVQIKWWKEEGGGALQTRSLGTTSGTCS